MIDLLQLSTNWFCLSKYDHSSVLAVEWIIVLSFYYFYTLCSVCPLDGALSPPLRNKMTFSCLWPPGSSLTWRHMTAPRHLFLSAVLCEQVLNGVRCMLGIFTTPTWSLPLSPYDMSPPPPLQREDCDYNTMMFRASYAHRYDGFSRKDHATGPWR